MAATADRPRSNSFIGREQELTQLHAAYKAACSGDGSLVMLAGEPGIGKTALCDQLAGHVRAEGGRVLFGHCYEGVTLPYLAFVEALRDLLLSGDLDDQVIGLGIGTAYLLRIVPELGERLPVESLPEADPQEQRWRLFQAVTDLLRHVSSLQPLLLILEDLHNADHGTLDLLLHVSRNLKGSRMQLIGTYRDVEVDRTHPLSASLAELRRSGTFNRIPLRGLTVDELHRMYEAVRGQPVSRAQAEAVHRATEGNPLFVQEVLRYLVEAGIVVFQEGRYVPQQGVGAGIPDGLRDVVGRRLSRLSEKTNRVLASAAVIGRDFRLDVLKAVAGLPEDEVLQALEEAAERSIVEQHSSVGSLVFRFSHAFFRQVLYEEIFAPRRIRWHQQVARALESVYARRLEEHSAELAEQYSHSTDVDDLRKAVHYGEMAARRAMSVFDYGEAVKNYEQTIAAQEVLDPEERGRRCDLLLGLAEALGPAGEPDKVESIAEEALELAESLSDHGRASQACRTALYGLLRRGSTFQGGADFALSPLWRIWAAKADAHAQPDTQARVEADIAMGRIHRAAWEDEQARALYRRAMTLARQLDDPQLLARAAIFLMPVDDVLERLRLAEEFSSASPQGVTAFTLVGLLSNCLIELFTHGRRDRVEELFAQVAERGERAREPQASVLRFSLRSTLAVVDGELESALELAEQARANSLAFGFGVDNDPRVGIAAQRALWYLGEQPRNTPAHSGDEIMRRIGAGACDEATRRFLRYGLFAGTTGRRAATLLTSGTDGPTSRPLVEAAVSLLEATVLTRSRKLLPEAVSLAHRFADLTPFSNLTSVGRHLGAASALLGRADDARAFYNRALEASGRLHFRPEIALTRFQLAELLFEHYRHERDAALDHLDSAVAEFEAMGMRPALERALVLAGQVRSPVLVSPGHLSQRELEVLRLIAAGRSNPQIAEELVISLNTVQRHVSNILAKTGAANRTEAALYARDKGLV
jgi:DNA-binding CsgD family transcriptional regulator